jgi:hypothetical protein
LFVMFLRRSGVWLTYVLDHVAVVADEEDRAALG